MRGPRPIAIISVSCTKKGMELSRIMLTRLSSIPKHVIGAVAKAVQVSAIYTRMAMVFSRTSRKLIGFMTKDVT
jgi:hypothetical protein